ncbi:MAG: hypothetical protein IT392_13395 [Nitrospirae bacterium]|nr:hypothetical protein [Nitrospirota bacterium]
MGEQNKGFKKSAPDLLKILFLIALAAVYLTPVYASAEGVKPRVLFMIAEQNIGHEFYSFWWWGGLEYHGQTMDMSAAETQLKESFLGNGFEVVDISATTGKLDISNTYRIADLTDKGAIEIAQKVNAEIVVKGKAIAKEGPGTPGSSVGVYIADITATAIRVDNGQVLGAARGHGVSRNISDVTGGTEALGKAATELANHLMEQINAKWPGLKE